MRRISLAGAVFATALAGCGHGGSGNGEVLLPCGPFPEQSTSPFVLPFQVGEAFEVKQGNCTSNGAHVVGGRLQYSYDFFMPIGTPVVASRDGTVLFLQEGFPDFNHTSGEVNFVSIMHEDGTIANYVHLTQDGALVSTGDVVRRGDIIALSGASGNIGVPHLHFHVEACSGCETVAVTFLNTRPQTLVLIEGETYTAEPY